MREYYLIPFLMSSKFSLRCDSRVTLKSLVTIRMNEMFPCLACYGQKAIFLFGYRDKDKHKLSGTKQQKWNWNNLIKKLYLRWVLSASCLWSLTNNYTVTSATSKKSTLHLIFFTNHIVIFKRWMDNWKMGLVNLEEVVRKQKGRTNRMM